jgi:exonuclease III
MKIAIWNLDFLRKASSKEKKEKLIAIFNEVKADVWILTETNLAVRPGEGYMPLCSEILPDPKPYAYKPGDHEVIIWSKHPMSEFSISETSTSVCARIKISDDLMTVYGTVIGVLGIKKDFREHLEKQTKDWKSLRSSSDQICVAGDFNVCWKGKHFPKIGRDELSECLNEMRLQNLTSEIDGNIDHIAISKSFRKTAECTWNLDKTLSDHIGVSVSIERLDLGEERVKV